MPWYFYAIWAATLVMASSAGVALVHRLRPRFSAAGRLPLPSNFKTAAFNHSATLPRENPAEIIAARSARGSRRRSG
jgi:hypothetical protein